MTHISLIAPPRGKMHASNVHLTLSEKDWLVQVATAPSKTICLLDGPNVRALNGLVKASGGSILSRIRLSPEAAAVLTSLSLRHGGDREAI